MISKPQVFPGVAVGVSSFVFPSRQFRYRPISLNITINTDANAGTRILTLGTSTVEGFDLVTIPIELATVSSQYRLTFCHIPQWPGMIAFGAATFVSVIPIPFDLTVEEGQLLSATLNAAQAGDQINTMVLVIDDEFQSPPKKRLPS